MRPAKGSPSPDQVDCSKQWKLYAQVCNRGSDLIATMIPGTFYKKDRASAASAICVAYTTAPIQPGKMRSRKLRVGRSRCKDRSICGSAPTTTAGSLPDNRSAKQ